MQQIAEQTYDSSFHARSFSFPRLVLNILRWIAYIPLAFGLTYLVECVTGMSVLWIVNFFIQMDTFWRVVIIIFAPPIVCTVFSILILLYGGAIALSCLLVCPLPKIGAALFGAIYIPVHIAGFFIFWGSILPTWYQVVMSIMGLIWIAVTLAILTNVYVDLFEE